MELPWCLWTLGAASAVAPAARCLCVWPEHVYSCIRVHNLVFYLLARTAMRVVFCHGSWSQEVQAERVARNSRRACVPCTAVRHKSEAYRVQHWGHNRAPPRRCLVRAPLRSDVRREHVGVRITKAMAMA